MSYESQMVDLLTEIRDNTRPVPLELRDAHQHPDLRPAHNRDVTDRLKAAERCVLDVAEALTGVRHDGVVDYDEVREALLSAIGQRRGDPVGYEWHVTAACAFEAGATVRLLPNDVATVLSAGGSS